MARRIGHRQRRGCVDAGAVERHQAVVVWSRGKVFARTLWRSLSLSVSPCRSRSLSLSLHLFRRCHTYSGSSVAGVAFLALLAALAGRTGRTCQRVENAME